MHVKRLTKKQATLLVGGFAAVCMAGVAAWFFLEQQGTPAPRPRPVMTKKTSAMKPSGEVTIGTLRKTAAEEKEKKAPPVAAPVPPVASDTTLGDLTRLRGVKRVLQQEAEIADLDDADKQMFLEDMGMHEPGLDRVIRAAYDLLGLQTYFTAGVKEVRAWTIHKGDTAPQAAGVIHTDFERGFIRAQTISFDDYISHHGEKGAQEAGKMRAEGKDYIVQDGDVMNFLFNV